MIELPDTDVLGQPNDGPQDPTRPPKLASREYAEAVMRDMEAQRQADKAWTEKVAANQPSALTKFSQAIGPTVSKAAEHAGRFLGEAAASAWDASVDLPIEALRLMRGKWEDYDPGHSSPHIPMTLEVAEQFLGEFKAKRIAAGQIGAITGRHPSQVLQEFEAGQKEFEESSGFARLGSNLARAAGAVGGFWAGAPGKLLHAVSQPFETLGNAAVGKIAAKYGEQLVAKGVTTTEKLAEVYQSGRLIPELAKMAAKDSKLQAAALKAAEKLPKMVGTAAGMGTLGLLHDPGEEGSRAAAAATQAVMGFFFPLWSNLADKGQTALLAKMGEAPWSKATAASVAAAIEGTGMTLTDVHFLSGVFKAASEQNWSAFNDQLSSMLGSWVGMGLIRGMTPSAYRQYRLMHPEEGALPPPILSMIEKQLAESAEIKPMVKEGEAPAEPAPEQPAEVRASAKVVKPLEEMRRQGWQMTASPEGQVDFRLAGTPGRVTLTNEGKLKLSEEQQRIAKSKESEIDLKHEDAALALERIANATMISNAVAHAVFGGKGEEMGPDATYFDGSQRGTFRFGRLLRQETGAGGKWEEVHQPIEMTDPRGTMLATHPQFGPGLLAVRRVIDMALQAKDTKEGHIRQETADAIVRILERSSVEDGMRSRAQAEAMLFMADPRVQAMSPRSPEEAMVYRDRVVNQLMQVMSGSKSAGRALQDTRFATSHEYGKQRLRSDPRPGLKEGEVLARRMEIQKLLEKIGDTKISSGGMHFRRYGALGLFFVRSGGVRIAEHLDIDTGAHEVGHALHKRLVGDIDKPFGGATDVELEKLGKELYGERVPKGGHYRAEGVAEYVARRLQGDPDLAAAAPEFTKWFNEQLRKNPKIAKLFAEAERKFQDWSDQGSAGRVGAMILDPTQKAESSTPALRRMRQKLAEAMDTYAAGLESVEKELIPKAEESARERGEKIEADEVPSKVLAAVEGASTGMTENFMFRATTDLFGHKTGESLREAVSSVRPEDVRQFWEYVVARRALEAYVEKGFRPGMSEEDARRTVQEFESKPGFQEAAKAITEYAHRLLDLEVEAGSMSPKMAQTIKDSSDIYVKFSRVFDPDYVREWVNIRAGKGFKNKGPLTKRIEGSEREIRHPLVAMIFLTQATIARANKARVARTIADFADTTPGGHKLAEKVEEPAEDTVTIYRDGKPEHWHIAPEIVNTMNGFDNPWVPGGILGALWTSAAHAVRFGATGINAGFAMTQIMMDTMGSLVYTKSGINNPFTILRGYFDVLREARNPGSVQHVTDLRAQGGKLGAYLGDHTLTEVYRYARQVMPGLAKAYEKGGFWEKTSNFARGVGDAVHAMTNALSLLDLGPRVAEYKRVYERAIERGATDNAARTEALLAAKEITLNFTKKGTFMRVANMVSPYSNAAVRGIGKFSDTFIRHPSLGAYARAFAAITVPSLISWWLQKDDPEYKKLPLWERTVFWNIFVGGVHIRIPKPPLLGNFFGTLPEAIAEAMYEKKPDLVKDMMWTLTKDVLPIQTFVPAAAKAIGEVAVNYDLMQGRAIDTETELRDVDPTKRATAKTTEAAKWVSEALGFISPKRVEVLFRDATGSLALDLARLLDTALGVSKSKGGAASIPVIRRVISDLPSTREYTRQTDEVYDERKQLSYKKSRGTATDEDMSRLSQLESVIREMNEIRRSRREGDIEPLQAAKAIQTLAEEALKK